MLSPFTRKVLFSAFALVLVTLGGTSLASAGPVDAQYSRWGDPDPYCRSAWSSHGGIASATAQPGNGVRAHASVSYFCFNWSNYGENVYRTSAVTGTAEAGGARVWGGWTGSYDTYYTSKGGPYYRESCYVWYNASVPGGPNTGFQLIPCPNDGGLVPWSTLLVPLFP